MAGIYSQGGSASHRYAGWLSEVEAKNFQFGGKVFNGSPSAIYVGSNLVWMGGWLTVAAQQAILGAFGQRDGWAVIKATNYYLTQLAASGQAGKDKATALAGFINEDPMMVCSLGLSVEGVTMPIRWCRSDGNQYIITGISNVQAPWIFDFLYLLDAGYTSDNAVLGNDTLGKWINNYNGTYETAIYGNIGNAVKYNTPLHVVADSTDGIYQNGVKLNSTTSTAARTTSDPVPMFAYYRGGIRWHLHGNISHYKITSGGVLVNNWVPFISKEYGLGMIDLLSGTFYQNQGTGTFTESYTRNGQPWTPSTP